MAIDGASSGRSLAAAGSATSKNVPPPTGGSVRKNLPHGEPATHATIQSTTQTASNTTATVAGGTVKGHATTSGSLLDETPLRTDRELMPAPPREASKATQRGSGLENSAAEVPAPTEAGKSTPASRRTGSIHVQKTQARPVVNAQDGNSGNDRVTVDTPNRPLSQSIQPVTSVSRQVQLPQKAVVATMATAAPKPQHVSIGGPPTVSLPPRATAVVTSPGATKHPNTTTATMGLSTRVAPSSATAMMQSQPQIGRTLAAPMSSNIVRSAPGNAAISIATAPVKPAPLVAGRDPSPVARTQQSTSASAPDNVAFPEMSQQEVALRKLRAPLADVYAPYIVGSDTSLADARRRLHTALQQTRQLRAAFTERVYGKYRVCLRPPPTTEDTIKMINADPVAASRSLQEKIRIIKEEKEIEKKEAQKLTAELDAVASNNGSSAVSFVNADNADQLMYTSAGLSLVILPEQNPEAEGIDMSSYPDRAPINPENGQRVRAISSAAATAGEVMLDRARKGAAMKAERQRRRQMQLASGGDPEKSTDFNYSRLSVLSSTSPPAVAKAGDGAPSISSPSAKKATQPPAQRSSRRVPSNVSGLASTFASSVSGNSKSIRARVQANMSVNTLLSLHPSAEELRNDGNYSAATLALIERGALKTSSQGQGKNTQMRFGHPFPESLGARQQQSTSATTAGLDRASSFLPPLTPSGVVEQVPVENRKRPSPRAISAILHVVDQFPNEFRALENTDDENRTVISGLRHQKKRKVSKLGFLLGLQRRAKISKPGAGGIGNADEERPEVHPMLATLVLRAVGLVSASCQPNTIVTEGLDAIYDPPPGSNNENGDSVKAKELWAKLSKNRTLFTEEIRKYAPTAFSGSPGVRHSAQPGKGNVSSAHTNTPAAAAIRGGGEIMMNGSENSSKSSQNQKQSQQQQHQHQQQHQQRQSPASATAPVGQAGRTVDQRGTLLVPQNIPQSNSTGQIHLPMQTTSSKNSEFPGQRVLWEDPSALLNQHLNGHVAPYSLAHSPHQLPMNNYSSSPGQHSPGDLSEYLGSLHRSSQPRVGYDWPAVGTTASNLASGHTSLGVFGLSQHRTSALLDYSAQDRAARAMITREQQTAVVAAAHAAAAAAAHQQNLNTQRAGAFLGGTSNHGYGQKTPHFSQIPNGHPRNSVLPTASSSVLSGRQNIRSSPTPNPVGSSSVQHAMNTEARSPQSGMLDQGSNDRVSSAPAKEAPKPASSSPSPARNGKAGQTTQPNRKRKPAEIESKSPEKRRASESEAGTNIASPSPEKAVINAPKSSQLPGAGSILEDRNQGSNLPTPGNIRASGNDPTRMATEKSNSPMGGPARVPSGSGGTDQGKARGLRFFVPPAPAAIPAEVAEMVLDARFHDAVVSIEKSNISPLLFKFLVEYLLAVGAAVPIPKALVLSHLKDRLNIPGLKSPPTASTVSNFREVVVASILLYLWKHHEQRFQDAFARSGRIDVDSQCKWLIQSAATICTSALSVEVKEWLAKNNDAVSALSNSVRTKNLPVKAPNPSHGATSINDQSWHQTRLALLTGSATSKMLEKGFTLDDRMDFVVPSFGVAVEFLDECRAGALRSKLKERVLLATFMSRRATMSLPFSNAYVSSMARAGAAMGHDQLFEIVQNEAVLASTMIPYDIFADEYGAWEDPCRPSEGFSPGITGEDLMRRAHARAMIHKSLKKLQDRHNIRGGTSNVGPYVDSSQSQSGTPHSEQNRRSSSGGHATPRGSSKRLRSSISEPPVQAGTGSACATSWALYESNHHSAPLIWRTDDTENGPYGRHNALTRCRSLSVGLSMKGGFASPVTSGKYVTAGPESDGNQLQRSTQEISWSEVACMFTPVEVTKPTSKSQKRSDHEASHSVPPGSTIFAPFVRRITSSIEADADADAYDASDSEEEDISDLTMLNEHQAILDSMKQKLSVVLEARNQQNQEQRKKN